MADSTGASDDAIVTFHVKSAGDNKYTISIPLSTTTLELKNKLSTEEFANVPAASQRLIYSGRVLKDGDTLASHNVKEGNTMHLVKSAASNQRQTPQNQAAGATSTSTPEASGVPTNIAAGSGNSPLAGLTGARYAGFTQLPSASMFGQDGGMGAPPSPEQLIQQLQDPNFSQMMREALQNPAVIDMMIQQNPQLRAMGPQARQMLQSPEFIRSMTDPNTLRQMAQFQRMMGTGPFGGGAGGQEAFPAPGVTTTTDPANRDAQNAAEAQNQQQHPPQNPFAALMGGAGPQPGAFPNFFGGNMPQQNATNPSDPASANTPNQQNPFAALFGNPQQGGNPTGAPQNPFGIQMTPEMMTAAAQMFGNQGENADQNANPYANLMNMFGGGGGGGGGGFGGPPDNRPPEERYATQLGQLNQMGFHDFDRNIQALRRSGGDINGALEWLFSQPES